MLVLAAILVLGVVIGAKTLFAPLPGAKTSVEPSPSCTDKTVKKGQRIRASQVQVSVYNGGSRSGLADENMKPLNQTVFTAGSVGNAPDEKVRRVQVRTTEKHDMAAKLVA